MASVILPIITCILSIGTVAFAVCPAGTNWSPIAGRCYGRYNAPAVAAAVDADGGSGDGSFVAARAFCQSHGADVVSFTDNAEAHSVYDWLAGSGMSRIAVGLYRYNDTLSTWMDGSEYTEGAADTFVNEHCLVAEKTTSNDWDTVADVAWVEESCCFTPEEDFDVVCEKPDDGLDVVIAEENQYLEESCFGDCPTGWHRWDDRCYGVLQFDNTTDDYAKDFTVYDAHDFCQKAGGRLPSLDSTVIEDHLARVLNKMSLAHDPAVVSGYYIGINDAFNDTIFLTTDQEEITHNPFSLDASNVNDNVTNCLMAVPVTDGDWTTIEWMYHDCCETSDNVFIICQQPEDPSTVPDSNPTVFTNYDIDAISYDCYKDVDECTSDPCQNDATCDNRVRAYSCNCPEHYAGSNCQSERNYCEQDSPCHELSTCVHVFGTFNCTCDPRFTGDTCERLSSLCAIRNCQNGATCEDIPNDMATTNTPYNLGDDGVRSECNCVAGYRGDDCETEIDECLEPVERTDCGAHGHCRDLVNDWECVCDHSWYGSRCQDEVICEVDDLQAIANTTHTQFIEGRQDSFVIYTCTPGMKFPDMDSVKNRTCVPVEGWYPDITEGCMDHCDNFPEIDNASPAEINTAVGFTANFSCNRGFRFPDNSTSINMTCLSTRQWDKNIANLPQCEVVQCPVLPIYEHQSLNTMERNFNQTVIFWCDIGYLLHDNTTARSIKCLWTGRWTATLPPCLPVKCPTIPPLIGGERNTTDVIYNTYAQYKCDSGTRMLDGATYRVIRCDATGTWSDNITDCAPNRCYPLPYVANARPSDLNATFTNVVTLTCIRGHRFFPRKLPAQDITCHDDHRWRPLRSKCEPINCPPLVVPMNASLTTEETLFSTVVDVRCDRGHRFTDGDEAKNTECLETERWRTSSFSDCKPVDCGAPPEIFNGTKETPPMTHYPIDVLYECFDDHKFIDGRTIRNISCGADGYYNETDLSCKIDRCSPVPDVDYAILSTHNTTWYTNVTYTCETGYEWPNGPTSYFTICQNTGYWSNTNTPPCEIKECVPVYDMSNATESTLDKVYDTTVNYTCDIGYKYHVDNSTTKSRYCNEEGLWEPSSMEVCQIVHCPPIMDVENATRNTNNTHYGTNVLISCETGYQFPDRDREKTIECTVNETWTDYPDPCEVVYCPPIKSWRNYNVNSSLENEFNSVTEYSCAKETQMFEDVADASTAKFGDIKVTVCAVNKQWDPPLVACKDRQTLGYELKGLTVQSDEAVYVGALAATLLSIMGVAIILLDIQKLMQDFKMMRSNIRSMYSQHKRRTQVSDSSSSLNRAASPPAEGF